MSSFIFEEVITPITDTKKIVKYREKRNPVIFVGILTQTQDGNRVKPLFETSRTSKIRTNPKNHEMVLECDYSSQKTNLIHSYTIVKSFDGVDYGWFSHDEIYHSLPMERRIYIFNVNSNENTKIIEEVDGKIHHVHKTKDGEIFMIKSDEENNVYIVDCKKNKCAEYFIFNGEVKNIFCTEDDDFNIFNNKNELFVLRVNSEKDEMEGTSKRIEKNIKNILLQKGG